MLTRPIVEVPAVTLPDKQIRPRVLGILQNEWVYDPPRLARAMAMSSHPEKFRRRMIEYALFAGCRTGRVLSGIFGETWCKRITWENASRRIGDVSSSVFPADRDHILACLEEFSPDVVIAFGKIAREGVESAVCLLTREPRFEILIAPHPCARHDSVREELRQVRKSLDKYQPCLMKSP